MSVLSLIAMACVSCSHDAIEEKLKKIDDIIETRPDSALLMISEIDTSLIHNRKTKALYDLLKIQSEFKNYIFTNDLAPISMVADQFAGSANKSYDMRAQFYLGKVYYNNDNMAGAIVPAQKSYDIAESKGDKYWMAKTSELISDILTASYMFEDALSYNIKAAELYKESGRRANYEYAVRDIASTILDLRHPDEAIALIDSILSVSEIAEDDNYFVYYCQQVLLTAYLESKDYEHAEMIADHFLENQAAFPLIPDDLGFILRIKMNCDEQSKNEFLESLGPIQDHIGESYGLDFAIAQYYEEIGDYKGALTLINKILTAQTHKIERAMNYSAVATQRDYIENKAKTERERNRLLSIIYMLVVVLLATITLVSIKVYHTSLKLKDAELANRINDIQNLSEEIMAKDIEREELFKQNWATFNLLCDEFFQKGKDQASKSIILSNLEREIEKFKSSKNQKRIINAINDNMNGLVDKLKNDYHFLEEDEINLIALVKGGLSARAICTLLDLQLSNFYTKKSRINDKSNRQGLKPPFSAD